jgi:hypothetical protein
MTEDKSKQEKEILEKIAKIKENVDDCHNRRFIIQKEIKKKTHDYKRLGNYIQRSDDDVDLLVMKLRKLRELK